MLWFIALPAIAGFGFEVLVFGPETYVRGTGEPVTVTKTFRLDNSSGTFTMRVHNHGVTSAVIAVNRRRVLSPEDFKKDRDNDNFVPFLERSVNLRAGTNEIAVELRSKPGTWLSVEIVGAYVPTVSDLDPEQLTMAVGDTASLTVTIQNPDSLRAMHVTLASGNATVVSVPPEVVLAAGATTGVVPVTGGAAGGPVLITATLNGVSADAEVTVGERPPPPALTEPLVEGATVVSGTGVANALVDVQVDGTVAGLGSIGPDGHFGVPVPALRAGQVVTATQGFFGLISLPSAPVTVRAHLPAPTLTSPLLEGSTQVTGTGVPGANVDVFVNGVDVGTGLVAPDGTFRALVASLVAGQQVAATQTVTGVTSIPSAIVTVVAVPPAPSVTTPVVEGSTNVSGHGLPGATVEVFVDRSSVGTVIAGGSGLWTLTLNGPLVAGQQVTARQTVAGIASAFSSAVVVVARSPAPIITAPLVDGNTSIHGTGVVGASVEVFLNSTAAGTTLVGISGTWTLALDAPLVTGQIAMANQTVEGVTSDFSSAVTVLARPPAPTVSGPLVEGQTTVSGTGIAGGTLNLFVGDSAAGSGTVTSTGSWAVVLSASLVAGQQITAFQIVGGNASNFSSPLTVVAQPPAPTVNGPLFADGTTVTGTGISSASLEVFADGTSLGTTAVGTAEHWALPLMTPLVAGQVITAQQTVAGIPSVLSAPVTVQAALTRIDITPAPTATLTKGQTLPFSARGTFSDGMVEDPLAGVVWSSDNTTAASISATGLATGTGAGMANIRATRGVVVSAPTALTVKPLRPTVGAPLSAGATTVSGTGAEPGATLLLFVNGIGRGSPANADASGQWTVSALVPALVVGDSVTARQTVASIASDFSAPVIVLQGPPAPTVSTPLVAGEMTVNGSGIPSASVQVFANALPVGTTAIGGSGTWSLPLASALLAGQIITAQQTLAGIPSAFSAPVTVKAAFTRIDITPAPVATLTKGQSVQFLARGTFSDGTTQDPLVGVTWSSDNAAVASLTPSGQATGTTSGVANIRAMLGTVASSPTALTIKPLPPSVTAPMSAGATVVNGTGADPGASVQVFVNGAARGAPAIANATGLWSSEGFAPALVVNDSVTARQTANGAQSDLSNAVIVTTPPAALASVLPASGQQGQQNLSVTLTGQFTHWAQAATTVSFGSGITVASLVVDSSTTATGVITIDPVAATGVRAVTVTTGGEIVSLANSFTVIASTPAIAQVLPNSGQQGQQHLNVTLTGQLTHWTQSITTVSFGPGIIVVSLAVQSPTSATALLDIDLMAALGPRTVSATTGSEAVAVSNGFAVSSGSTSLFISSRGPGNDDILAYDGITGTFQGVFVPAGSGGLTSLNDGMAFGPDGNFYAGFYDAVNAYVTRYDGRTGAFLNTFITAVGGGLTSLAFGPNGNLFLSFWGSPERSIREYNGATGAFIRVFAEHDPGATGCCPQQFAFGPNGNLYVATEGDLMEFDGITGAFIKAFGLTSTDGLAFGPDGLLYVSTIGSASNYSGGQIFKYDPISGTQLALFVPAGNGGLGYAHSLRFGPDGNLYAVDTTYGQVLRYNGTTGAFIDVFVPKGSGGLSASGDGLAGPVNLLFGPSPQLSPVINLVTPNSGQQGQSISVNIVGQSTHFLQGVSLVAFGPGITVASLAVNSATTATAMINIDPAAVIGTRAVTMTTGAEVASLVNGFTVTAAGTPVIAQLNPNTGPQGQQNLSVTITGQFTNFVQGTSQVSVGSGITVGTVTVTDATHATAAITIAPNALIGARTVSVTTGSEVASLVDGFTVLTGNPVLVVSAGPNQTITQTFDVLLANYNQLFSKLPPSNPPVGGVLRYDGATGAFLGDFVPAASGTHIPVIPLFGPDGNLYVLDQVRHQLSDIGMAGVVRYDGQTGALIDQFVPYGSGGLQDAGAMTFGSDGDVYIYDYRSGRVNKYDGVTGAFVGAFVSSAATPDAGGGLAFGPDGNLYVAIENSIYRFNGTTGSFIDVFISGVASGPASFVFHNGYLYANDPVAQEIRRFNATTGAFVDVFVQNSATIPFADFIGFAPDGTLWAGEGNSANPGDVQRFDGTTGALINVIIPKQSGELAVAPGDFAFVRIGRTTLFGTVTENPIPGTLRVQWSQVSGPGPATFDSPNAEQTSVDFSAAGTYVLRLSANDSQLTGSSDVTVTVLPASAAPGLTSVTPTSALQGQPLSVTVGGQNTKWIGGTTQVDFGAGITVSAVQVSSPTSLTAQLSLSAGAAVGGRTVTVTTGSDVVSRPNAFTVISGSAPVLTSVTPNKAEQGQVNLTVTVTGLNTRFAQGLTQVSFGSGITVGSVQVLSATSLTAQLTVAAGAPLGRRTLYVTTQDEVVSLANALTVTIPSTSSPTLTLVAPNAGRQGQAGPVAIVGANTTFVQGTTQVDLGPGIMVSSVTVSCPTCLMAQVNIADNAPSGPHTVTVTTGTQVVSLANGFTVQSGTPILTSLSQASGQPGQTFPVTITGKFTNFVQGTTLVSFGAGVTVSNVVVSSPAALAAQLTLDLTVTPGTRTLTVTTGSEVVSVANVFTVLAGTPALVSLNPGSAAPGQQNLPVTITGRFTNFVQGTSQVTFGAAVTVNSVTVASATSLTAQISIAPNATPGTRTVTVTTGNEVASFTNGFTVGTLTRIELTPAPTPAITKGQTVTFSARGTFSDGSVQDPLSGVVWSSDNTPVASITAVGVATGAAPGVANIRATLGSVASATTALTVKPLPPVIQGPLPVGSTAVSGAGAEPSASVQVFVNGTPRGGLAIANATGQWSASGLAPALIVNDVVTARQTANGVQSDVSGAITIGAGTPTLLSVTPSSGTQGQQNLNIAITGQLTHFVQGISTVFFASSAVTVNSVTVSSPTSLTANISIALNASLVPRTVTVTTGTEVASRANGFTVQAATNQAPVITIAPTWSDVLPNRLTVTYTVTDDGLPLGGALTVSWSKTSGPGNVGFLNQTPTSISVGFDQPGTYVLTISATDTQLTTTQNITVTVTGTVPPPPTVSINTPTDGAEITSLASVIGSVASSALASWTLEFRMQAESSFRALATGTTPVTNAVLGTLDPTVLLNGLGLLRLRATDTVGQTSTFGPISVVVTQNQKIGNFTVSFNDLTVPVAGLPIQVVRTYDSRNKAVGDFGVGWRLDLNTVRLATNAALGDNWLGTRDGIIRNYCLQPSVSHVVTITFSDGTVFQFQPTLNPQCQAIVPPQQVTVDFTPVSTTPPNATLAIVGNNQPFVSGPFPGSNTLLNADFVTTFDPDLYRLTMPDGRALIISKSGSLQMMTDLNGNRLTVSPSGITHSSGKSVTFQRDSSNRITQITDPADQHVVYSVNASGDLESVTDRAGNTTRFTYDASHGLLTIVDPRGVQPIKNVYDDSGRLIQHIDAFGNSITYTHNLNTRQEVVTDRLGNVTVNEYDANGNIVKVTDALGGVTTRTYDARNNLLSETNPLGKTRSDTYDANNNRLTETDSLGNTTTYTYNSRDQVLTITDPLGRVTTNTYDANGNLTSTADPLGKVTTYTYNARGLRTSMTDALSNLTTYEYDTAGNLTKQTDTMGHATTYTYDANGNRLTESKSQTTASGTRIVVTQYQYDGLNHLTQTTFADGGVTRTTYNSISKQATTIDQLGHQTSYEYDLMGRLTKTTFPDGTTESSSYDAEGSRLTSTDRGGRVTSYAYDPLKRLTQTTFADGTSTATTFDGAGDVTAVAEARGDVTQYAYDAAGRRTRVTDAIGHVTSFTYDATGNQVSMTDANGNMTQYQYDNDNRRLKTMYPDTTSDSVGYDALGRTLSKTDQAGKTTQFGYDKLGRLTTVIDAISQQTAYTYDELGSRTSQTDANGHVTRFAYDAVGRRLQRTLPLGMSETSTYDAAGNLVGKTDFNGKTTTYAYDTVNRLRSKTPDATFGAPVVRFGYSATGQRLQMVDASGTTTYTYDTRDRLLGKTTPQGALTYTYDPAGNLTGIRSSNTGGTSVNYTYDGLNRLTRVTDNRLTPGVTTYTYDITGNLATFQYPNGVQHGYGYNTLNRLTNLVVTNSTSSTLASYSYTLGPTGNRSSVTEFGGRRVDYTYDSLYRLTAETISGAPVSGTTSYTYDPVGNRVARLSPSLGLAMYAYDANDRLGTDGYDNNGNTTASGGTLYSYDFENQLTGASNVTVAYDGDGNRVSKTAGGVTTKYLVDDRNLTGYAQVLEEISGGTVQRVYTYGLQRISESQASGTSFYGYDGHGNVRLLTDITGAVTDRYDYDAFGTIISQNGTTPNVYLYSGEQNDPNLGFYYLRARYLNPSIGRFVSMDTAQGEISSPISLHKYGYVGNEPVLRLDPSGNQFDTAASIGLETVAFDLLSSSTTVHAGGLFTKFGLSGTPLDEIHVNPHVLDLAKEAVGAAYSSVLDLALPGHRLLYETFFGTVTDDRVAYVQAGYSTIYGALGSGVRFYAADGAACGADAAAYVTRTDVLLAGFSQRRVSLCNGFFSLPEGRQAGVVIHETSHLVYKTNFGGVPPEAYGDDIFIYATEYPDAAVRNAASYENFALGVAGLLKP